jgi:hypothetical protein
MKTHIHQLLKTGISRTFSMYGGKTHMKFWWENLRKGNHLEDSGVDGRLIVKCIFQKWDEAWTGSIWLRIGASGGLL